jgi:hypothetical protein
VAKHPNKIHEFTIVLAGVEELTPDLADALYLVFDDGTAGSCNGRVFIDFHRKAPSLQQAVHSAVDDTRKAAVEVACVETEESRLVQEINATRPNELSGRLLTKAI